MRTKHLLITLVINFDACYNKSFIDNRSGLGAIETAAQLLYKEDRTNIYAVYCSSLVAELLIGHM
ncbi:MAG TPA: hypothetical protein VE130_06285 [Nitrososphaeraceae archaeon]|nr:hypothetical protein [Nitrososphaeraceae archaeon]